MTNCNNKKVLSLELDSESEKFLVFTAMDVLTQRITVHNFAIEGI